jgi:16S rRNA (guanine(966)-N(2))-methyltransferase RsmD
LYQILAQELPGSAVLDLFAGTGALGIEALSRGAARVDFVERDPRLCSAIERNLEKTGFADRGHVHRAQVEQAVTFLEGPYHLVLLDPPYEQSGVETIMEALSRPGLLEHGGLVVVEHSSRAGAADRYGRLKREDYRRYGDTALSSYRMEET